MRSERSIYFLMKDMWKTKMPQTPLQHKGKDFREVLVPSPENSIKRMIALPMLIPFRMLEVGYLRSCMKEYAEHKNKMEKSENGKELSFFQNGFIEPPAGITHGTLKAGLYPFYGDSSARCLKTAKGCAQRWGYTKTSA